MRTTARCEFDCSRSCAPTLTNSIHSVIAVSTTDKSMRIDFLSGTPPAQISSRLSSVINSEIETVTNNICGCRR